MWKYQKTDELYHHGVLGMKWGVRRYQNKDGSLTSLGKKKQKQRNESDDEKEVNRLRKKKSYELSNAELKKINERRRLESEYVRLHPNTIKKGVTIVAATAATLGGIVAIKNNGKDLINTGKAIVHSRRYRQLKIW